MVAVKKKTVVKKNQVQTKVVKKLTGYYAQIRSRHPSHNVFRGKAVLKMPFRSVIRFGSTTELDDNRIEINSTESIKNSASKLRMKNCFVSGKVKTADWWTCNQKMSGVTFHNNGDANKSCVISDLPYPIVAKAHFGSRGNGNYLLKTQEELQNWMKGKDLSSYLFEKFYSYAHEFRLHITEDGCFYTCRKALKKDIPEKDKWHFHDDTCVWFLEENESFYKPNSWKDIVENCVKGLKAVGGDLLAFDVKVQSPLNSKGKKREYQDFIILECNSAPSCGAIMEEKYLEELPKILRKKFLNKK